MKNTALDTGDIVKVGDTYAVVRFAIHYANGTHLVDTNRGVFDMQDCEEIR